MKSTKRNFIFNFQTKEEMLQSKSFTWSENIKWALGRGVRNASIIGAVLFIGSIMALVYREYNPKVAHADPVVVDTSKEMLAARIEALKDGVVNQIRGCERGAYVESDGHITFDSNEKASVGTMQWQIGSIVSYEKRLYGKVITGKEAVLLALDDKAAGDLARDVMFKTGNMAGKDWVNCAARFDSDRQIVLIKGLEAGIASSSPSSIGVSSK